VLKLPQTPAPPAKADAREHRQPPQRGGNAPRGFNRIQRGRGAKVNIASRQLVKEVYSPPEDKPTVQPAAPDTSKRTYYNNASSYNFPLFLNKKHNGPFHTFRQINFVEGPKVSVSRSYSKNLHQHMQDWMKVAEETAAEQKITIEGLGKWDEEPLDATGARNSARAHNSAFTVELAKAADSRPTEFTKRYASHRRRE